MNSEILKNTIHTFNERGFLLKNIKIEKLSGEYHLYGEEHDANLNLHSCGKTITSLAVGICLQNNLLSLDDRILTYLPLYKNTFSKGTETITIKNLLHMTSGKHLRSLLDKPLVEHWERDWLAWFLEAPLDSIPGNDFYYSSHCSYVLGRIIENITGKTLNDFLELNFWNLLGIQKPYWDTCPLGHTLCAGNLYLTCNDFSKIGLMLLNYGTYQNHQVVNSSYIKNMMYDIVPSCDPFMEDIEGTVGYGYSIWKCSHPNTFRIWGAGGNYCIVDYDSQICVTITADRDPLEWKSNNDNDILRDVYKLLSSN